MAFAEVLTLVAAVQRLLTLFKQYLNTFKAIKPNTVFYWEIKANSLSRCGRGRLKG